MKRHNSNKELKKCFNNLNRKDILVIRRTILDDKKNKWKNKLIKKEEKLIIEEKDLW